MPSAGDASERRTPQTEKRVDVDKIFREGVELDRAMRRAFRAVCFEHKALGFPLIVYQNGRTVEIPPEEIVVPDEDYVENGPI